MTLLDDFKQFVADAQAGAQYAKWAHDNPGDLARWATFRDAILAGQRPTAPTMTTPHGKELVDGGVLYLNGTTPAPTPTPPPPPPAATDPSGVPMPVGDITGWHQIFADDFTTNVPSGANVAAGGQAGYFPQAVSSKWAAYPWPWTGTPTWANYYPERVVSIHDSMLDIWLHDEQISGATKYLIAAVQPKVAGINGSQYMNSCRIEAMLKCDLFGQYHISNLLWPKADDDKTLTWPKSGEIDFPEGNFDGTSAYAFMHNEGATSGGDQVAINAGVPVADGKWHNWRLEWVGGVSCKFFVDGVQKGATLTSRVPLAPMRFVLQNGGQFGVTPKAGINGHVYYDWLVVYTQA